MEIVDDKIYQQCLFPFLRQKEIETFICVHRFLRDRFYFKCRHLELRGPRLQQYLEDKRFRNQVHDCIADPSKQLIIVKHNSSVDKSHEETPISELLPRSIYQSLLTAGDAIPPLFRLKTGYTNFLLLCEASERNSWKSDASSQPIPFTIEQLQVTVPRNFNSPVFGVIGITPVAPTCARGGPQFVKATKQLELSGWVGPLGHLSETLEELKLSDCKDVILPRNLKHLKKLSISNTMALSDLPEGCTIDEIVIMAMELDKSTLLKFQHCKNLSLIHCTFGHRSFFTISTTKNGGTVNFHGAQKLRVIDVEGGMNDIVWTDVKSLEVQGRNTLGSFLEFHLSQFPNLEHLCAFNDPYCSLEVTDEDDVHPCEKLRIVKIRKFQGTILTEWFMHADFVEITDCSSFRSISDLSNVRRIALIGLEELTSLEGLGPKNQNVSVTRCPKINDFSPLRHVKTVTIECCKEFRNASDVSEVEQLTIIGCSNLLDVSALCGVQRLTLKKCDQVRSLRGLESVKMLEIEGCRYVKAGVFSEIPPLICLQDFDHREISMKDSFTRLADSLYLLIFEYLARESVSRCLMTNTYLYKTLMRKCRQVNICSNRNLYAFFSHRIYRAQLAQRMEDSSKQLSLDFSYSYLRLEHISDCVVDNMFDAGVREMSIPMVHWKWMVERMPDRIPMMDHMSLYYNDRKREESEDEDEVDYDTFPFNLIKDGQPEMDWEETDISDNDSDAGNSNDDDEEDEDEGNFNEANASSTPPSWFQLIARHVRRSLELRDIEIPPGERLNTSTLEELSLDRCSGLRKIPPSKTLRKLSIIKSAINLNNVKSFPRLEVLILQDIEINVDLALFNSIRKLCLSSCSFANADFTALQDNEEIKITVLESTANMDFSSCFRRSKKVVLRLFKVKKVAIDLSFMERVKVFRLVGNRIEVKDDKLCSGSLPVSLQVLYVRGVQNADGLKRGIVTTSCKQVNMEFTAAKPRSSSLLRALLLPGPRAAPFGSQNTSTSVIPPPKRF